MNYPTLLQLPSNKPQTQDIRLNPNETNLDQGNPNLQLKRVHDKEHDRDPKKRTHKTKRPKTKKEPQNRKLKIKLLITIFKVLVIKLYSIIYILIY